MFYVEANTFDSPGAIPARVGYSLRHSQIQTAVSRVVLGALKIQFPCPTSISK